MYFEKVTVWCGFWIGGVFGSYFVQNDVAKVITVNSKGCRSIIINFIGPKLNDLNTNDIWFQQNNTTYYKAHAA